MIQQNDYVPFEDGIIFESQGYYQVRDKQKCEYFGKPANPANCHAHHKWCIYHCDYNAQSIPIGSDFVLLWLIGIYLIIKRYMK